LTRPPGNGHRGPLWLVVPVALLIIGGALIACGLSRPTSSHAPPRSPAFTGPQLLPPAIVGGPRIAGAEAPAFDRSAAPPRWISVPAIGVSARVVRLGLNPDHTLQVPRDPRETGWYANGPEPGEQGGAVIAGHVDSQAGPGAFYRLGELRRGALVSIRRADGTTVRFRVDAVERWAKTDFPTRRVYGPTRDAALRLITCGGLFDGASGHYLDNTVVYASAISR
jgi:hypothetical protein